MAKLAGENLFTVSYSERLIEYFAFFLLCLPAFLPITLSHPPSTNSSPVRNVSRLSNPDLLLPWSCLGIPFVIHHVARGKIPSETPFLSLSFGPPICSQSILFPNWKIQHSGVCWYFENATNNDGTGFCGWAARRALWSKGNYATGRVRSPQNNTEVATQGCRL